MAISKDWLLSKSDYYADFVIIPLAIAVSMLLTGFNFIWFVTGIVVWSLAEYIIHRYLFHDTFRNHHWLHHVNEGGYVGVSALKTIPLAAALFIISYLIGTIFLFQGVAFGYLLYIVIHDAIHHDNFISPHIQTLKTAHIRHHEKGEEANFGVITMFWDIVFRTHRH